MKIKEIRHKNTEEFILLTEKECNAIYGMGSGTKEDPYTLEELYNLVVSEKTLVYFYNEDGELCSTTMMPDIEISPEEQPTDSPEYDNEWYENSDSSYYENSYLYDNSEWYENSELIEDGDTTIIGSGVGNNSGIGNSSGAGNNSGTGNGSGTGNNSGTGNGSGTGNSESNNNGDENITDMPIIDNAGEWDGSPYQTYTLEEAIQLIEANKWVGGYVENMGYLLSELEVRSGKTNIPLSGNEIYQNALEFERVGYKYGGLDKNGIDCSGLITAACRLEPRWATSSGDIPGFTRIYPSTESNNSFKSGLQCGDILVWIYKSGSGHAAIYVENNTIFHAHGENGAPTNHTHDLFLYWIKTFGYPKVYRK